MLEKFRNLVLFSFSLAMVALLSQGCSSGTKETKIDRKKWVERHKVTVDVADTMSSLTIGNGRFAFTVDFTGLQTFPEAYENGIPLGTQSEWGWHSFPNVNGYVFDESLKYFDFHGRKVPYDVQWPEPGRNHDASEYFRQNPHRLHLGMVGFELLHADGSPVQKKDIMSVNQTLNPLNGEIHSSFLVDGSPVDVITYAHQDLDLVSAQVKSKLVEQGRLKIRIRFPYPTAGHTDDGCNWNHPTGQASLLTKTSGNGAVIRRQIDSTHYSVRVQWKGTGSITEKAPHEFYIVPEKGQKQFSFSCLFAPEDTLKALPGFDATAVNSHKRWKEFWMSGGAVDLMGSTDQRAPELERRIVLSLYLTRVQCAGDNPPQETGLTYNSWYGKFHLEMYWWHAAHFALWGHPELLEKGMDYYARIAHIAAQTARRQGFKGCRWPKMTDPSGMDSPSSVGSFLIWQQPHFIYLAELLYRCNPADEILKKYAGLVFASADFMASYAWYDSISKRYVLGPTLIPAQERYSPETTINPPFELSYWYYGLNMAQLWRERLNMGRNPEWDKVLNQLSPLPHANHLYLGAENVSQCYTEQHYMTDHPMVLGAYGILPACPHFSETIMKNTFMFVYNNWNWDDTWGWDFPMAAMCAVRLGMPEKGLEVLMKKEVATNTYLLNGHNYQNGNLRLYLPGNGGLLTAVAMMCAGYDGATEEMPGFPKDGKWKVKWEGLNKLP